VEALAGLWVTEADIATVIGIPAERLRRHYSLELEGGRIKANSRVAENLYRRATGEGRDAVIAAIFWLKARAGWRDTNSIEFGGRSGQPIKVEIVSSDANL
jgi:hypothetical protein